jgi:hypothetical protein
MAMNLRDLFQAAKHMIAPTPEAELPLMRHAPLDQDSDTAFWSDMTYLHELRKAILEEIREGAFVWEMPIPVLSEPLLAEVIDWPLDEVAAALAEWRCEIEEQAA